MKNFKMFLFAMSVLVVNTAGATETVRKRYTEIVDFSAARVSCDARNEDWSLMISLGDIGLWPIPGKPISERECFRKRFQLEDFIQAFPSQSVEFTVIEIEGKECDRRGNCRPKPSVLQTRASLRLDGVELRGYVWAPEPKPQPERGGSGRRNGCEYQGKLGGGWWCR